MRGIEQCVIPQRKRETVQVSVVSRNKLQPRLPRNTGRLSYVAWYALGGFDNNSSARCSRQGFWAASSESSVWRRIAPSGY
jgi:hypothetical protein